MWISVSVYLSTYTHSCFCLCAYMDGTSLLSAKVAIPSLASLGKDPLKGTRLCCISKEFKSYAACCALGHERGPHKGKTEL